MDVEPGYLRRLNAEVASLRRDRSVLLVVLGVLLILWAVR